MLWYGYIYYISFNVLLALVVGFFLRLYFTQTLGRTSFATAAGRLFLSTVLFFFFVTFSAMNYLLDYYQELVYINSVNHNLALLTTFTANKFISPNVTGLNLVQVYTYPFIYVFLFVTVLSIIFCLTYNTDELLSFMFYCKTILLAGYVLFFTDSLILFFLAYEMLLIPSFFILYKFAKTRRCVEAAYLMFFWTQFGALFLIFAFLYLFFVAGSSQFSVVSSFYFSTFEVNFIFLCCLVGFGVKLPI